MIYYKSGSESTVLGPNDLEYGLYSALVKIGPRKKVLAIPPDFTRFHSRAGDLTTLILCLTRNLERCSKRCPENFSGFTTGGKM
jgi:hypothetical protein